MAVLAGCVDMMRVPMMDCGEWACKGGFGADVGTCSFRVEDAGGTRQVCLPPPSKHHQQGCVIRIIPGIGCATKWSRITRGARSACVRTDFKLSQT